MIDSPIISIIIPLYNGEKYISRTINSVLNQSFNDFEIIVVNDGSTDDGCNRVNDFSNPKITLVHQKNSGVSAARNKGIEIGKGEYFAFLDADDEWDEFFLEKLIHLTKKYPNAGIYTSGYRMVFPSGSNVEITLIEKLNKKETLLVSDYFHKANGGAFIQTSGVMIPRNVIKDLGPFIVGKQWGEDVEMWARIGLKYDIAYNTNILFTYHQTIIDKKPRLSEFPKYQLHLLMLENQIKSNTNIVQLDQVKNYIATQYLRSIQWFVLNANKEVTLGFIKNNNINHWNPLLSYIISFPIVWQSFQFYCYCYKIKSSRKFLSIIGGYRKEKGVLFNLVKKS